MKKFPKIFLVIFLFLSLTNLNSFGFTEKTPSEVPGWILVWQDEFKGNQVDTGKWRVENADLDKNAEWQYYSPDEVYLENGFLVLRSQKRDKEKRNYTSGLVETKDRFTQTYGRFEIRAKLPRGQGIWPAIWLMNAVGKWPPEIDIVEMLGQEPDKVYMTNHFGTYPNNQLEGAPYVGLDFSKDFHTFTLEWEPEELRWYIDGVKRFSTKKNVPNVPFYIILNTAVGGNWPGYPDETTQFPQFHLIDYVAVYQRDIAGTKLLTTSAKDGWIETKPAGPRYKVNSHVEIIARPDIGYKFSSWSGDITGTKNPVKIKMDGHREVIAHFIKDPQGPKLLSRGAAVKASSTEKTGVEPVNVVDGDLSTRWSSQFSDPQWIYIDLGKVSNIRVIRLQWEAAYGKEYKIEISNDALNWKTIKEIKEDSGGTQNIWLKDTQARYVRLYGVSRATEWGYSLWEFEIFGD